MSLTLPLRFSFKSLPLNWTKIFVTWILKTKETMKRHKNFFYNNTWFVLKKKHNCKLFDQKGNKHFIYLPKCQAGKDLKIFFRWSPCHVNILCYSLPPLKHLNWAAKKDKEPNPYFTLPKSRIRIMVDEKIWLQEFHTWIKK